MNGTCKTCRHWTVEGYDMGYRFVCPEHTATYEPLSDDDVRRLHGHIVRYCKHPKVLFYERPARDGAAVVDGSEYNGALITAEDFGCVLHDGGSRCDA